MTGASVQDWIFWLTAAVLALAGLALGAWALFWDRSRGRKRCPKCWYSMEGVPESQREGKTIVVCPECGKGIPDPRKLLRTRRRIRWVAPAALLLAAAYAAGKAPAWRTGGWTTLAPTTVLAFVAPTSQTAPKPRLPFGPVPLPQSIPPTANPTIGEELAAAAWNRLFAGQMARWQSQHFISRFLRDSRESVMIYVNVPDRWPIDEPVPVRMGQPSWARFRGGMLSPARGTEADRIGGIFVTPVSALLQDKVGLTLELRIPEGVVYAQDIVVPIQLVPDPVVLVRSVDSDELSGRIREALGLRVVTSFGRLVVLAEDRNDDPLWQSLAIRLGYRIELFVDGREVGRATCAANGIPLAWKNWSVRPIDWKPGGEAIVRSHPESIRLIVTGDPIVLLRAYEDWAFHGPPPAAWTGRFETSVPVEPDVTGPKD